MGGGAQSVPENPYERGRIINRCLQERMVRHEAKAQTDTLEEPLLGAYLDHQVRKRLLQYLFSGTNGVDALDHLLHVVVQLAFSVLLSQERNELEDALNVRSHTRVLPAYSSCTDTPRLGTLDLGSSSALGYASAAAGALVHIDIGLSDKQMARLHNHPWTLSHLLRAIDTVIPIDFDFRLHFGLRESQGSFRLSGDVHSDSSSLLGMTTTLAGKRS